MALATVPAGTLAVTACSVFGQQLDLLADEVGQNRFKNETHSQYEAPATKTDLPAEVQSMKAFRASETVEIQALLASDLRNALRPARRRLLGNSC